jgi:hypothetical protein
MPPQYLKLLKDIIKARQDFKKGKLDKHEVENARKNASLLINSLIEYNQRCDLVSLEKGRMQLKYSDKETADLIITDSIVFLIRDTGKQIDKITDRIEESSREELEKAIQEQKGKLKTSASGKVFQVLRKELGDFEITF